jgi:MFS transporter, SP family, galactose:H+ symporter
MGCMWIINFLILIIFNSIVEIFGLGTVFCGFSIICFVGAAYSYFLLPETKGLSVDAIQSLFQKKRRHREDMCEM